MVFHRVLPKWHIHSFHPIGIHPSVILKMHNNTLVPTEGLSSKQLPLTTKYDQRLHKLFLPENSKYNSGKTFHRNSPQWTINGYSFSSLGNQHLTIRRY